MGPTGFSGFLRIKQTAPPTLIKPTPHSTPNSDTTSSYDTRPGRISIAAPVKIIFWYETSRNRACVPVHWRGVLPCPHDGPSHVPRFALHRVRVVPSTFFIDFPSTIELTWFKVKSTSAPGELRQYQVIRSTFLLTLVRKLVNVNMS